MRVLLLSLCVASALAACDPAVLQSVQPGRLAAFNAIRARFSDPRPLATQIADLTPHVLPEFSISVPLTGTFGGTAHGGLEGAVEYLFAINRFYNRGFSIPISSPAPTITPLAENVLSIRFQNVVFTNYLNQTTLGDFDYIVNYEDCGPRVATLIVNVGPALQTYAWAGTRAPYDICIETQANCVGSNKQFETVDECAAFLNSLELNTCKETFRGNNLPCRYLHHLLTKGNPNVHCPHVGRNSVPCSAASCPTPISQTQCGFNVRYSNC